MKNGKKKNKPLGTSDTLFFKARDLILKHAKQVHIEPGQERYLVENWKAEKSIKIGLQNPMDGVLVYYYSFAYDADTHQDFLLMYVEDTRTPNQTAMSIAVLGIGGKDLDNAPRIGNLREDQKATISESIKIIESTEWKEAGF